jgi:hypothetical protein
MASKSSHVNPRNINPMAPELSDEARKAIKAVFDAMSSWQTDVVNNNEKNLDRVIDKIAAAAEALGWPEEIGEIVRAQMHAVTKMQTQTLDHMISAWEEQMNSPSAPSTILAKLRSVPTLPVGSWPGAAASQMGNPFEACMQITQQWQKLWADAMAPWMKAGNSK